MRDNSEYSYCPIWGYAKTRGPMYTVWQKWRVFDDPTGGTYSYHRNIFPYQINYINLRRGEGVIVEDFILLEYDALSNDEDTGEAYLSTHLDCLKIPISEYGSMSTHNTTKDIQGVPGGKDLTSGECSLGQTISI